MSANMELVLALEGFDTDLYTLDGKVQDEIAVRLNGTDVELMNRLGATVVAVRRLKSFTAVHGLRSLIAGGAQKAQSTKGRYLAAMSEGITDALFIFEEKLVKLSEDLQVDPGLHLTYVYAEVMVASKWWLESLCSLLDQVEKSAPQGSELISLVHSKWSHSVAASVLQALGVVLGRCHQIFCQDLLAWIVRGEIANEEFCVRQVTDDATSSDPWSVCCIKEELVPNYMDEQSRQYLLFIGHAARLLTARVDLITSHELKLERGRKWSPVFSRVFNRLDFDAEDLKIAISDCYRETGTQVWTQLFPSGCEPLVNELRRIADFYFLGRTPLWAAFARSSCDLLSQVPTADSKEAIRKELLTSMQAFDLVDPGVIISVDVDEKEKKTCWDTLRLTVKPMSESLSLLLLSKSLYDTCEKVFRTVLRVCCVQIRLDRLYLNPLRRYSAQSSDPSVRRLYLIRWEMMRFVRSVQFFLHFDSITPLFNHLISEIRRCRQFQQAKSLIDGFAVAVFGQCGLNAVMVQQLIADLLGVCVKYCRIVERTDQSIEETLAAVDRLGDQFNYKSRLLFKSLSELKHVDTSRRLDPLLQRLDFTGRFSATLH